MSQAYSLPLIDGSVNKTLKNLLGKLLESSAIGAVLVPMVNNDTGTASMALVTSTSKLEDTIPVPPVLCPDAAKLAGAVSGSVSTTKIAVVLRPCEIAALVELSKFNQAVLDDLLIIGVDCVGTVTPKAYNDLVKEGKDKEQVLTDLFENPNSQAIRAACKICDRIVPAVSDINVCLVGADDGQIFLSATEAGSEILSEKLSISGAKLPQGREEAIKKMEADRQKAFEAAIEEVGTKTPDIMSLAQHFSDCLKCLNCRRACPICYCHECVFDGEVLRLGPDDYLNRALKRGFVHLPADVLLFHLTRMNHMATSCVGCGLCESACPQEIELLKLFKTVGHRVQALFGYNPGASAEDLPPFMTFKEEESFSSTPQS